MGRAAGQGGVGAFPLLLPDFVHERPELPWGDDSAAAKTLHTSRSVAGNKVVGRPAIANPKTCRSSASRQRRRRPRRVPAALHFYVATVRCPLLVADPISLFWRGSPHLLQQRFAQQDFVAAQTKLEERLAQPSRGEGRHDDVGVQHNPHEMARKTSSSVNSPCASAKGSVRLRSVETARRPHSGGSIRAPGRSRARSAGN